jgi:hypothetical protein
MVETVGWPLAAAEAALAEKNIAYTVTVTHPGRQSFPLAADQLYVVREIGGGDGVRHLLVAAKMGKAPS